MATEHTPIDASNIPELRRLAEEIHKTRAARVIRVNDEDLAVLAPVKTHKRKDTTSRKATFDAVLAAAGSWKGIVDADELKKMIAEERGSDRSIRSLRATSSTRMVKSEIWCKLSLVAYAR